MRVAIVHDYLNQAGGAERVVGELHRIYPEAPIYTSILDRSTLWPALQDADIRTSWMQRLPGLRKHFKKYLPFYPGAIESFDLSEYDLVISSSSAFGKGAITRAGACHVCYCYTPMRFAWDYQRYVERESYGRLSRLFLPALVGALRRWDLRTAARPDVYIVTSSAIAERVRRLYGRDSELIPPPVDLARYRVTEADAGYYLVVSRLNPYKRIDLAVAAFNGSPYQLVVVGDGPDRAALEALAESNVSFVGRRPDEEVANYYSGCRAVIFPGEEDFGLVPLEANASGRPVIAYRAGGALDTVIDGKTGLFFDEPTPAALRAAVARCDQTRWDRGELRRHAEAFGPDVFRTRILDAVQRALKKVAR